MIRLLVIGALSLFLSACGTQPVKDDSAASDLDALRANVRAAAKPRTLPNGKLYCVEDAKTNDARDDCALDLEDTLFLSERDKESVIGVVDYAVERIKLRLNPCGFWDKVFNRRKCNVR